MDDLSSLFLKMLNMSITAAYVIGAVLLFRLLMRRLPKKYSYCLWGIAVLRLMLPFSVPSSLSLFNLKIFRQTASGTGGGMEYISGNIGFQAQPQINSGFSLVNDAVNAILPPATPTASVNPLQIWIYVGARIWILGIAGLLLYMAVSHLKLQKRVKYAVLAAADAGQPHPHIYECEKLSTPFVTGIFRPRIYIPLGLEGKERAYILAHEAYHIRRGDTLVKAAAFLIAAVYWYHPLVWLSYLLMIRDMEMSCDEHVIKALGEGIKQDYSRCLLSFATSRRPRLSGPLAFGESMAGSRIKNVLHYKKPALWIAAVSVFLIAALAAVCLTGRKEESEVRIEAGRAEEPFRFTTDFAYSFAPGIKTAYIYADIYKEEHFMERMLIAQLDVEENGRAGEGILTAMLSVEPQQQVSDAAFSYVEENVSGFINIPLETMATGFAISRGTESFEEYRLEPETPRLIVTAYMGDAEKKKVEVYPPDCLEKAGVGTEEFEELLAGNEYNVLVYVMASKM